MKVNQLLTICGIAAALFLSAGSVSAQNENGGGGGRRGGGNFDPAQMQQRFMERVHDELGFTNDTEWNAVQPLVQKVFDAQRDARGSGMGRMFRGNRGGGNGANANANAGGGRGGFFGEPSPEAEALQKAIDDNAPTAQIKAATGEIPGLAKSQTGQARPGTGKPAQSAYPKTGSPGHPARIARITKSKSTRNAGLRHGKPCSNNQSKREADVRRI